MISEINYANVKNHLMMAATLLAKDHMEQVEIAKKIWESEAKNDLNRHRNTLRGLLETLRNQVERLPIER